MLLQFCHFSHILSQPDFPSILNTDQIKELISVTGLTDEQRLDAIFQWINHNPDYRQNSASELIKHVRPANLSREYISSFVHLQQRWNNCAWFVCLLEQALKTHSRELEPTPTQREQFREVS